MEQKITFPCKGLTLEGLFNQRPGNIGAVVTHPHPLYGGDMSNPVVESLVTSFNRKNITTLRFNFRGTGRSEGTHEDGIGESEDVIAAIAYLLQRGCTTIYLAGYSFGSWVLAHMEEIPQSVIAMIFVAPPIALLPFRHNSSLPLLELVVTGEEDEIAPPALVTNAMTNWNKNARLSVIDGADHFFFGAFPQLEDEIDDYLVSKRD